MSFWKIYSDWRFPCSTLPGTANVIFFVIFSENVTHSIFFYENCSTKIKFYEKKNLIFFVFRYLFRLMKNENVIANNNETERNK